MHSWIEIKGSALRNNYRIFCELAGGKGKVAPVLKSNAYGHGLSQVFQSLHQEAPPWLVTNYVYEAVELRKAGYKNRLMVCGPVLPEEIVSAFENDLEIFLVSPEIVAAWCESASKPKAHLKIDTGMSRQGFLPKQVDQLAEQLSGYKDQLVGICTHFANVEDVLEHDYAQQQLNRFAEARQTMKKHGYSLLAHAASSASTLILDSSRLDLARIGVSLYGVWPSQTSRLSYYQDQGEVADLQEVLSWKTKISIAKEVPEGDYIGYGCTYRAPKRMRVGVLPVGYAEGLPRLAGRSHAYVLIDGVRCPIVGRICMNMCMVDLAGVPQAGVGSEVVLIGTSKSEHLSAEELGEWSETIHYEVFTRLHPAIPRKVV